MPVRILISFHHFTSFHESQSAFRVSLCDSFNTPEALNILRDLVSKTNVYINSRGKNLSVDVVENVARWVGQMLRVFGLGEGENSEIGWGQEHLVDGTVNVCLFCYLHLQLLTYRACSGKKFSCLILGRYHHSAMVSEVWRWARAILR
jgi:hypothetical protein